MGDKKKETALSWDDFVKLGNPENAPDPEPDEIDQSFDTQMPVRVHYEKKGRGGKAALVVKGMDRDEEYLKELCKKIKSSLGLGGSVKDGEIIIQSSNREKVMEIIKKEGFKNVKPAGG